jgi:NADP-dependent 3-hydroxy acid dehydrogenase YdfG
VGVLTSYQDLKDKVIFNTGGACGISTSMAEVFIHQQTKVAFINIEQQPIYSAKWHY